MPSKCVIVMDEYDEYFSEVVHSSLESDNYQVTIVATYRSLDLLCSPNRNADVIVVGCPKVDEKVEALVEALVSNRDTVMVYTLEIDSDIRFDMYNNKGVKYVGVKTYDPVQIAQNVRSVLDKVEKQSRRKAFAVHEIL